VLKLGPLFSKSKPLNLGLYYKGCGFLFDLALANLIHFSLVVLELPWPFAEVYSFKNHLISLYLLTFINRFYFSLIFGVSCGQALIGFQSEKGGWILKRMGGGLRVVIEFIATPLFLVDSFSKNGRQDWKEFLSGTYLSIQNSPVKLIKSVVIVFGSLSLLSIAPLLTDLKNADGWVVSFLESQVPKIEKGSNFANFKIHMSNRFHFKTLSSLSEGRFLLIPGFEIKKANQKSIMTPMFSVYDSQLKVFADIRMIKRISLEGLIQYFTKGNPFVSLQYPILTKEKRASQDENEFRGQLLKWTRDSFTLSVKSIFKSPLLVPSLVEFRKYLLSILRAGAVPEVDLLEMGNATFLRFRQNFEKHLEVTDHFIETYLPLIDDEVVMWEIIWKRNLDDALSRKEFMSSFFSSAEWYYGDKDIYDLPENELDFRPLMLVDFYIKKDITNIQKKSMEGYSYHLFFDLARKSLESENNEFQKLILERIGQFSLVGKMRNAGEDIFFSEEYIRQLQELYYSLKAQDKKYFGL